MQLDTAAAAVGRAGRAIGSAGEALLKAPLGSSLVMTQQQQQQHLAEASIQLAMRGVQQLAAQRSSSSSGPVRMPSLLLLPARRCAAGLMQHLLRLTRLQLQRRASLLLCPLLLLQQGHLQHSSSSSCLPLARCHQAPLPQRQLPQQQQQQHLQLLRSL